MIIIKMHTCTFIFHFKSWIKTPSTQRIIFTKYQAEDELVTILGFTRFYSYFGHLSYWTCDHQTWSGSPNQNKKLTRKISCNNPWDHILLLCTKYTMFINFLFSFCAKMNNNIYIHWTEFLFGNFSKATLANTNF